MPPSKDLWAEESIWVDSKNSAHGDKERESRLLGKPNGVRAISKLYSREDNFGVLTQIRREKKGKAARVAGNRGMLIVLFLRVKYFDLNKIQIIK